MHEAAYKGRLAIAKRLLEGGADPTLRNKAGKTAIDYARQYGYSEVVALLSEPRYAARACTLIAQRCRADVQRRRLGHTRTTGFRPLGERMLTTLAGACVRALEMSSSHGNGMAARRASRSCTAVVAACRACGAADEACAVKMVLEASEVAHSVAYSSAET